MGIIKKGEKPNNVIKTSKPKKNLVLLLGVGLLIVVVSGIIYLSLQQILETEKYYVLNIDIPAKTQVNPSMLQEVVTSKGTAPQNALNIREVQQGTVYSKIPLKAGDILSESNTGLSLDSNTGIPEDWLVTSFNVNADDAVGGNIDRGDYFDIIAVDKEDGAKYFFHNVLALDLKTNAPTSTVTAEGKVIQLGETLQYIVGMPAKEVAQLHYVFEKYDTVKLALSPTSLRYKKRNVSNLTKPFIVDNNTLPSDLFEGTDAAFTPVLRDENGRPVNHENCDLGKITPASLCEQLPPKQEQERDESEEETPKTEESDESLLTNEETPLNNIENPEQIDNPTENPTENKPQNTEVENQDGNEPSLQ